MLSQLLPSSGCPQCLLPCAKFILSCRLSHSSVCRSGGACIWYVVVACLQLSQRSSPYKLLGQGIRSSGSRETAHQPCMPTTCSTCKHNKPCDTWCLTGVDFVQGDVRHIHGGPSYRRHRGLVPSDVPFSSALPGTTFFLSFLFAALCTVGSEHLAQSCDLATVPGLQAVCNCLSSCSHTPLVLPGNSWHKASQGHDSLVISIVACECSAQGVSAVSVGAAASNVSHTAAARSAACGMLQPTKQTHMDAVVYCCCLYASHGSRQNGHVCRCVPLSCHLQPGGS